MTHEIWTWRNTVVWSLPSWPNALRLLFAPLIRTHWGGKLIIDVCNQKPLHQGMVTVLSWHFCASVHVGHARRSRPILDYRITSVVWKSWSDYQFYLVFTPLATYLFNRLSLRSPKVRVQNLHEEPYFMWKYGASATIVLYIKPRVRFEGIIIFHRLLLQSSLEI